MSSQKDTYKLANGVEIPCLGFGTWQTPDGETAVNAVRCALDSGYIHIDTAQVYGNEASVGKAIRLSGVKRGDIFVTTKLWNSNHTYELTKSSFEESMDKLGLEYLDMFLIHWPNPKMYRDRWEQANAESKLRRKNLDYIVLNSLRYKGAGFGVDTNKVLIIGRDGSHVESPLMSKREVADLIVKTVV